MRPRGRWGDLIIAIIPIYWCSNILINSNALLKVIEWQDMSSFLTVRVRGKQWYWVYKLGGDSNLSLQNNIGIIGNNSFFSLKNVFGGFYGAINNSFWSSWSESFYFSKTNDSFAQTEPYFYNDSALLHENCFVSYDSSANNIFYDSCGVAIGDVSRLRLETFSVFECIYPSYYEIPALYYNDYLLGDSDLLGHDYNFNYSYSYASYTIIKDCLDYELNESAWFNNCDVEDLFILEYCCSSCIFNDHDFFYIESNSTYFNCWPIYCDSFTNLNKFSYIIDCDTEEGFCLYCNNGSTFSYSDDSAFNLKFDLFTSFYSLLDFASLDSLFYSLGTDLCYNVDHTLEDCSSFYSGLDDCSFDCQHYPYDCFSDLDNSPFIFDINQTDDLDLYCEY